MFDVDAIFVSNAYHRQDVGRSQRGDAGGLSRLLCEGVSLRNVNTGAIALRVPRMSVIRTKFVGRHQK
jgi:hypothetical protein